MKVILTGASGFVGGQVAIECVRCPLISSLLIVTRRVLDIEDLKNPKVTQIIHDDFSHWPAAVLEQLTGAEACIWAVGGKIEDFPDIATARHVGIDFTIAGAKAMLTDMSLTTSIPDHRKFKFIYCSGWGAEWDQDVKLYWEQENRRLKGSVEAGLFEIAASNSDHCEVYCLRPGGVLSEKSGIVYNIMGAIIPVVKVTDLAKAFVQVALRGYCDTLIENSQIIGIANH